jgi:hypothetical protein
MVDGKPDLSGYDNVDQAWFDGQFGNVQESAQFVTMIPVYETTSRNEFRYDEASIKAFNQKIMGRMGYLGHQDQKTADAGTGYRTPVARYVASRVTEMVHPTTGKKVKASEILTYVSQSDVAQQHFVNVREGTAGSVSIDGDAWMVREGDTKVILDWQEVRSIDFVNNYHESVSGAGVTAIVRESFVPSEAGAETSNPGTPSTKETKEPDMADEITLTKIQESAAGREVKLHIENAVTKTLSDAHAAELTTINEAAKKTTDELTETKAKLEKAEGELKTVKEQAANATKALGTATLVGARAARFDELTEAEATKAKAENRDPDNRVLEMAKKSFSADNLDRFLVADDDDKFSKGSAALNAGLDASITTITEMVKNFGAFKGANEESDVVTTVVTEAAKPGSKETVKVVEGAAFNTPLETAIFGGVADARKAELTV